MRSKQECLSSPCTHLFKKKKNHFSGFMLLASFVSIKLIIICFEVCNYSTLLRNEVLGALGSLGGGGAFVLSTEFAIRKMGDYVQG